MFMRIKALAIISLLLFACPVFFMQASVANESADSAILVVGDSLSAAYQIDPDKGWVKLLANRLQQENYPYQVINASISGETSHGGLSRLPAALELHRPQIVIIELGANDGLRGLPLQDLRHNLAKMIQLSQSSGASVVLLGMQLPPNYGPAYTSEFRKVFSNLARKYNTALFPFFLDGIATRRELMQEDNLHPNEIAQPILLENIWPILQPLL